MFDTPAGFWTTIALVSEWAIRLIMLPIVPTRRSPEAAKGWLLFIFFIPWIGLLVYWLIGRPTLPRWRLERLAQYQRALVPLAGRLRAPPGGAGTPADAAAAAASPLTPATPPAGFAPSVQLATSLGALPDLAGNRVELLHDYNGTLARIAADIDAAHHSAHLCFYIFGEDARTQPVIDALARAVGRGVACRVLFDYFGSKVARRTLLPRLRALGIEAYVALPLRIGRKFGRYDLRNHRKIVVVDGTIGYTGSQNMVAADFKPGLTYSELMVRLEGPAVLQLQAIFGSDWYAESGQFIGAEAFPPPQPRGPHAAQMLANGPSASTQRALRMVINLVYAARRRVVITTPYFIPSPALQEALETAVQRGVEVHLIVDQQVDQFMVGNAQRSYYDPLLAAGVQIHEYHAGFLHTKSVSVDGAVAWIGSCNMDMRSFQLNEEVVALFFDAGIAAQLEAIEAGYRRAADTIDLAQWRGRPTTRMLIENLTRLVSPLL